MVNGIIIGYGNPDRQDDGVALEVLKRVIKKCNLPLEIETDLNELPSRQPLDLFFALQLLPEFSELLSSYDFVCFIDAHTGNIPQEVNLQEVESVFQRSPFTHHTTPNTCLALASQLYGKCPKALLVSIRGYEFGFSTQLSPRTDALADQATDKVMDWITTTFHTD